MDYKDYQTASERHLSTCLKLKEIVVSSYSHDSLLPNELKTKNELLCNIYYLSGYIIECIVNYGILKCINFEEISTKQRISDIPQLKLEHNDYKVSYSPKYEYGARYYLYRPAHRHFPTDRRKYGGGSPNIDFFKNAAGIQGKEIDQIHSMLNSSIVIKLFRSWSVETRYSICPDILNGNSVNERYVLEFLKFADLVYMNLTYHIIPKL